MLSSDMTINKSVPIPLYFQLKTLILDEIKSGNYKVDDAIPTESELCEMFDLSRTTVRQAVMELVQEGWLYRVKSKGTFVSRPKLEFDAVQTIRSFNDEINDLGMTPKTRVLKHATVPASPEIAALLQVREGDKLLYLRRLRYADGEPVVIADSYLPYDRCGFLMEHDLANERMYSILAGNPDTDIAKINRTIRAVEATAEDAKLLHYTVGKPIQHIISVAYNSQGVPIEYLLSRFRADLSSFSFTTTR